MEHLWVFSNFAEQQCANHDLAKSTIADLLPFPTTGRSKHCVSTCSYNTIRVLVRDNRVESVIARNITPSSSDKKVPGLSQHCKSRMLERDISKGDVKEALGTPRLAGGVHKGAKCTVVVGTSRKQHAVLTAYKNNE